MKKLVLTLIALMALFTLFRAVAVFADKSEYAGNRTLVTGQE